MTNINISLMFTGNINNFTGINNGKIKFLES